MISSRGRAVAFAVKSLVLFLAVFATTYVAAVADREIGKRMDDLQRGITAFLEKSVGRRIGYGGISPSLFQFVEIRDLTVYGDSDGPLLSVKQLRIHYDVFGLLRGKDPVSCLKEIRIANTGFSIDLERDRDLVKLAEDLLRADGSGAGGGGSRFLGVVSGESINVTVRSSGAELSLSNLFFSVKGRSEALEATVRGGVAAALPDGLRIASTLKAQGTVDPGLRSADVKAELSGLTTSLFEAGRQTFQISWRDGALSLRKIQDSAPVDLRIDADLSTGGLSFAFQTERFQPSRLVKLRGSLAAYNTWLTGIYTGQGTVRYGWKDGSLGYEGGLSVVLKDQLPLRDVRLDGDFQGGLDGIRFSRLEADTPRGAAGFTGDLPFSNLHPQGTLTLRNVEIVRGERLDAVLSVVRDPAGLRVRSESLAFGDQAFDSFAVSVLPTKDAIGLDLDLSFSGIEADGLLVRGSVKLGPKPSLEGVAVFMGCPVDQLLRLATGTEQLPQELEYLRPLLPLLRVDAEAAFDTDLEAVHLSCDSLLLSQENAPENRARLSLRLDDRKISVPEYSIDWEGVPVTGTLTGELTRQEQISFDTSFRLRGIPYSVEGSYSPPLGLYLRGSYGLDASLIIIGQGGISFEAKADGIPVPLADAVYTVSFDMEGDFPDDGNWNLNNGTLTLADLPLLESRRNLVEVGFSATPQRVAISRIRFSDAFSVIEGSGRVAFPGGLDLSAGGLADLALQAELDLKAIKGTESFTVSGSYGKEKLDGTLAFQGVPLKRFGAFALTGDMAGSVRIGGSLAAPQADIEARLVSGRIGIDPFRLSLAGTLSAREFLLKDLDLEWLSHRIQNVSGTVRLDREGAFGFTASYAGEYFGDPVDVSGSFSGAVRDLYWDTLLTPILERRIEATLALDRIRVKSRDVPPWSMRVGCGGGVLSLDGGPNDKVHATLDQGGEFRLLLESPNPQAIAAGEETADPLPVQGEAWGTLSGAKIDATIDVNGVDLQILNAVVKTDIFQVSSGTAEGRGLSIRGPVGDPDYRGRLALTGAYLRSKYTPDEIGPLRTDIVFSGKSFSMADFSTFAGKAALRVAASFRIDHWVPVSFDLALEAEGTPGVHMKTHFGTVHLDGFVVGRVRIAGDDKSTAVKGGIQANDCQITLSKWEGGEFIPEEPPTIVALTVETGKRVEFLWPSENWPVVRTYAAAGGRGRVDVTYRGDTGAYTVSGSAEVQGGEIYYFDRSFYLRSGTIEFREDEKDFDPHIEALAEIREWDQKANETVKIYLEAEGKLSQFVARLRSDPSRSDVEILSMIGAPVFTRVEEDQNPIASAAMLGADIIGRLQILRPFEQTMRDMLNLDVFSIRTQLIQNVLAQKVLGLDTNPLDNTSLSLGKYLGNDLYLEMMVRLQEQRNVSGRGNIFGVDPEIELNMEWTTPFFLLEWSFLPKTPENLFLTDNSVSFKWRFSY